MVKVSSVLDREAAPFAREAGACALGDCRRVRRLDLLLDLVARVADPLHADAHGEEEDADLVRVRVRVGSKP